MSEDFAHRAAGAVSDTYDTVHSAAERQPLVAIGTAIGVGLLFGMLITKATRPPLRLRKLQQFAGTDYRSRDLERALKRIERAVDRGVPRAYEMSRETAARMPEILSSVGQILSRWQANTSATLQEKAQDLPSLEEIKSMSARNIRKWMK